MFRVIPLLVALGACSLAANNPVREVTSQATRVGNQLIPAFYKGYIYWIGVAGPANEVTIYAPDGHLAFSFVTQNGNAHSVAIDTDGSLAVGWHLPTASGIDFRDPSGTLTKTIQTGRYLPSHLSFAEDHSLWALGWQVDAADRERADRQDYMTVRKYLPDGKEAGAYLPRSLFPPGLEPAEDGWQNSSSITVGHERVGLWVYSGTSGDKTEWVELDLNGNLLNRWRLEQLFVQPLRVNCVGNVKDCDKQLLVDRLAFTQDGHLFAQGFDREAKVHRVYALDRDSSTWREVETPPSGRLEGADGDELVFSDFALGPMHLRWYKHP